MGTYPIFAFGENMGYVPIYFAPPFILLQRNNRGGLLVVSFDFRHPLDNSTNVRKTFHQWPIC
jgi:hypothetical protein